MEEFFLDRTDFLLPTLGPIFSLLTFHCFSRAPHDIQNVDFIVPHKFKHYRVSQENQFNLKEFSQFFTRFFRFSCHLQTQFSQLLIGQIGKFLCLSHKEFPEVFETPTTFDSSPFQSGVIAKIPLSCVFFGTPCIYIGPHFQLKNLCAISF